MRILPAVIFALPMAAQTWTAIPAPNSTMDGIVARGGAIYASSRGTGGTSKNVWKSTNNGASWTPLIPSSTIAALPASPSLGQVIRVTDGNGAADTCSAGGGTHENYCVWTGTAWAPNAAGMNKLLLSADGQTILSVTNGGYFARILSNDTVVATRVLNVAEGGTCDFGIRTWDYDRKGDRVFYSDVCGNVYLSVNQGATFTFQSQPFTNGQTFTLAFDPFTSRLWIGHEVQGAKFSTDWKTWNMAGNCPSVAAIGFTSTATVCVDNNNYPRIWDGTTGNQNVWAQDDTGIANSLNQSGAFVIDGNNNLWLFGRTSVVSNVGPIVYQASSSAATSWVSKLGSGLASITGAYATAATVDLASGNLYFAVHNAGNSSAALYTTNVQTAQGTPTPSGGGGPSGPTTATGAFQLSLSSANAAAGSTVTVTVSQSGAPPSTAALQWVLNVPSSLSLVSAAPSAGAAAAGKALFCSSTKCLLAGSNNSPLANGLVASLTLQVASSASGNLALQLSNASAGLNDGSAATPLTAGSVVSVSGAPAAVAVTLTPASAALAAGASQQFTASVTGSSNTAVTWSLSGPGTLSSTGLYTAPAGITAVQTAVVTATSAADSTKSASASITVSPAAAVGVTVSPASANLAAGAAQQFTATVTGSSNTAVTWSLNGPGTLSATGLYTAPAGITAVQTAVVTATSAADSTKTAAASITVNPASPITVTVTPSSATVAAGSTQQFTATVTGTSATSVSWSVTGLGSISNSGLYTAPSTVPSAQTVIVKAVSMVDSTKFATAAISLTPVSSSGIAVSLSPVSVQLAGGGTQQFTATVTGAGDGAGVTWSLSGPGTLSSTGFYTAPAVVSSTQTVTVKATAAADPTKSATATVTLQAPSIPTSAMTISPASALLGAGGTQQFSAGVAGTAGAQILWSVIGAGSITASGLYTAPASVTAQQTVTIKATAAADTTKFVTATVVLAPVSVVLTPATSQVSAGGTRQLTATVTGTANTTVTWTLNGPGSVSNSGLYTAPASLTAAVTVIVTARSAADPTVFATASIAVSPAASISISPSTASVNSGATLQFTATVTGAASGDVTWSLNGAGTISSGGLYTAPNLIGAQNTAIITARSVADPSKSASATVTLNQVNVRLNSTQTQLTGGSRFQFTATVDGTSNTGVTWSVSGGGTLSSTGMYTAPPAAGTVQTAMVTARSQADSSKSASAIVTVLASRITITPVGVQLNAGGRQQFSASVTGLSSNTVTWSVEGPGSISPSGVYTAPALVTANATATVRARSTADPNVTATVAVGILVINVSVVGPNGPLPNSTQVAAGATQQLLANVSGTANKAVTWRVEGPGSISERGVYTAPASVASKQSVRVIATSVADSTRSGGVTFTIVPKASNIRKRQFGRGTDRDVTDPVE